MKVFAHRGFSGKYPENTMLAFEKAIQAGADGIELDIHESRDGQLVIIHDENLFRTTGVKALVSDLDLQELTTIRAARTQADAFDTTIPSFREYCDFAAQHHFITNIEIKTNATWYPEIEAKALAMIYDFGLQDRVIISSFNWLSITRVRQLDPAIPCALLYCFSVPTNLPLQAHSCGVQYLHPDFKLLNENTVLQCKGAPIGLNVWTVNTPEQMQQLIKWDVSGVITNYPDLCLSLLGR